MMIFVVLFVFSVLLYLAFPYIYLYSEDRNNEIMRKKSILDCTTMPYHCAIEENRLSDLSLIKSKGYNIESKDGNSDTALTRYIDNPQAVKILLKLGANSNSTGRDNRSALVLALVDHKPYFENAELLIKYGANINNGYIEKSTNKQITLLGYAISHKNITLTIFLLKHGADQTIKDGYGYTACDRVRIYQLKTINQLNKLCFLENSIN